MPECEFAEGCDLRGRLFRSSPRLVQEYEGTYCDADRSQCARYMVASEFGPEKVPLDLLPFQIDRAKEAIAGIRKWSRDEVLSSVAKKGEPMKEKRSDSAGAPVRIDDNPRFRTPVPSAAEGRTGEAE